jgi:ketosteroid isomerase-like protein
MSQENVEVVRRALAAFNSGEMEQVLAIVQPDFEARIAPELSAEPDTYRGSSGVQRYFDSFREAFEEIRFEVEDLTDAGDSVVVGLRMTATGKVTKIPVEQRNAGVWTVVDGKVSRIETYVSLEEALRAAGIEVQ